MTAAGPRRIDSCHLEVLVTRVCLPLWLLTVACGPKASTPEPAPAPTPSPAAAPVAAPAPAPGAAPAPEPAAEPNLDVQMALTFADGTVVKGRAIRVERGQDWFAEKGWTDKPLKLTVPLAEGTSEIEVPWTDIRRIQIAFGGPEQVNCSFDSTYEPMLYLCELNTTATVTTADGKRRTASSRHPWRFTFEDGTQESFWLYKLPLRKQESEELSGQDLQIALRDELLASREGRTVEAVEITPGG